MFKAHLSFSPAHTNYSSFAIICAALSAGLSLHGQQMEVLTSVAGQATIEVDAGTVKKKIDSRLFGSNIEWFYNGNEIFDAATNSLRTPIVDQTKNSKVSLLRFPGGTPADYYHWRDGIGPQQARPTTPNFLDEGWSKNTFGTHEFLEFCRRTGAEPMFQANVVRGTAREAADWVSYVNAPTNTERAANGSVNPFGVKLWEIGNEPYIRDGMGYANQPMSASDYATKFVEYATAMKQADPTIKVGAVGGSNFGRYHFVRDSNWNREVLQRAGSQMDFFAVHNGYAPLVTQGWEPFQQVYEAMLAFPRQVAANLADINNDIEQYAPASADRIQLAITEWGPLFAVEPGNQYTGHAKTLASGVYTASMLGVFLDAKRVNMANFFQLMHPLFIGSMDYFGTPKPSLLALSMYSKYFGTRLIGTKVNSPTIDTQATGMVEAERGVPLVEAVSSLSADGKKLYVMMINKSLYDAVNTNLKLANVARIANTGTLRIMTGPSPDANNGNDLLDVPGIHWATQATAPNGSKFNDGNPGTIQINATQINVSKQMQFTLPAMSVTNLEFSIN